MSDMYYNNSSPITFRPGDQLGPILREVADKRFRGNVSDLIKTWLKEQATVEGHFSEIKTEQDELALIREAKNANINVSEILSEALERKLAS